MLPTGRQADSSLDNEPGGARSTASIFTVDVQLLLAKWLSSIFIQEAALTALNPPTPTPFFGRQENKPSQNYANRSN